MTGINSSRSEDVEHVDRSTMSARFIDLDYCCLLRINQCTETALIRNIVRKFAGRMRGGLCVQSTVMVQKTKRVSECAWYNMLSYVLVICNLVDTDIICKLFNANDEV